jgi:hypothetical protein
MAETVELHPYVREFLVVFDKYKKLTGLGDRRASFYILNGGLRIDAFRAGANVGVHTIENAMQALSDRWPAGKQREWPAGIRRPKRTVEKRPEPEFVR